VPVGKTPDEQPLASWFRPRVDIVDAVTATAEPKVRKHQMVCAQLVLWPADKNG
jgi:hypothetical protein